MHRRPVESTSLESIGYDSAEQKLEVEFKHGAVYAYLEVPGEVFEAFIAADSKGTFFNSDIKPRYDFVGISG